MKFSKWIVGTAFLFSAQIASVQGAGSCDPCDPCYQSKPCDLCDIEWCDVEYDFYVDALYWKLCRSDLDIDLDDDEGGYADHDWSWGYRIGGNARYKNWDLGIRYTSFCDDVKTSKGGDAKHEFDYDVLDIEAGYTCCLPCDGLSIRPIAGVKLAWIEDEFDKSENNDGNKGKFDYTGYGLYLGCSARWELCSYSACDRDIPIALVTRATTGILHGEFDYGDLENADHSTYKNECIYNPVHELYVGLDFSFCDLCGCGNAFFQVGYEVQHWGSWREWFSDDDLASWGLGGLVLRFGASF